jgi:hypothetical protein
MVKADQVTLTTSVLGLPKPEDGSTKILPNNSLPADIPQET